MDEARGTAHGGGRKHGAGRGRSTQPSVEEYLTVDDVQEGVADMISMVQVEATFPDGTKLVTVHDPIR